MIQFFEKLNDKLFSFILTRYRSIPTFFYSLFRIRGAEFLIHQYNAAFHIFVMCFQISFPNDRFLNSFCFKYSEFSIVRETYSETPYVLGHDPKFLLRGENKSKVDNFFFILAQLMLVNDITVQTISTKYCTKFICMLSTQKCNRLMRSIL